MIKRENEEEERDNFNNNNNDEKRTLNALFKRTRIWTYRWIYERFVSYEPLCFTRVIFVQNEALMREKLNLNFFWKKTWDFYSFPLFLGQQFWLARGWRRKKWKRWPRSARLLLSSFVGCFCRRKFVVSLAQKRAKKNECVVVSSFIYNERERHNNKPQSALRFVLRII